MKKLLLSLLLITAGLTAFSQSGSMAVSGIKYRVNDTTAYQSAVATAHAQGYSDIYWNNQATTPHWDIWNGASYDHDFGGGGSGTVTSVALTVPSIFSVSGSPITTSGTLAVTLATQTANTGFFGPTSGSAASPTFRVIVTEDISGALTANRTVTTASATIQADNLNIVYLDAASPENFTIDQLTDDSQVILVNKGAADWTLVDGTGVTSSGSTVVEAGEMAVILYDTPTAPIVFGGSSGLTTVAITDVTGMGTGVEDFLVTPSSANLRTALTDENGTGAALFNAATTPDFTTGLTIGGAAASRKILVGNGTNFVPSTETWAVPGTSGNVLVSDGTNWTSSAGSGLYWLLASGGARTGNQTLSGNVSDTYTGTFTGGSDVTPIRGMYFNKSVTQTGSATNKESDLATIEGLLTASGTGVTQRLFGLTIKPTQSGATGYFGWLRGYDPVTSNDGFRFGKPQASPTSTANNFEFLGGTSGNTGLTLQVATGSISFSASSAANIVFRSGSGTSNTVDFGFGTTSIFTTRAAANLANGRGTVMSTDGANATSTATQLGSFAKQFEGSFWTGAVEEKRRSYMVMEASTATNGLGWLRTYSGSGFAFATVIQSMNLTNGNVGIGIATPSAMLHLPASTTAASTASLKINEGSRQTAAEDGTINYVSNNLEFVETSTVYTIAKTLTGTATLNFGSVASLGNETLTITVTGAADGDVVSIGVPNGSMTAGLVFTSWVSASNTVSVQCYNSTVAPIDPASGTFRASVTKY